jgi:hypothetical protein
LFSIFIFISYGTVVILFAGAFTVFAGAVVIALGFIYQAFTIPFRFLPEIIGTLGMGFFGAGVCFITAYGLYLLGRLLIRLSTRSVRWMLKKPGKPMPELDSRQLAKKTNSKRIALACVVLSVAGLVLFSVSGLPVKFFTIFNSMKPQNITLKTAEFEPGVISKISAVTAHSHIKLSRNTSDKIIVSYEQPDWLDYELGSSGSMLSFYEKSNGRLPLFDLSTLHESRTELAISLPEGCNPEVLTLESKGGFVFIENLVENIVVKTYTGGISLDTREVQDKYNVMASTENGYIEVGGSQAGQKTGMGTEYYLDVKSDKTIELKSSRGNIIIK